MKLLLLIPAVMCVIYAQNMQKLYLETQAKYHMKVLPSSRLEAKAHYKEFCEFAMEVKKHNAEDQPGYLAEVNMFALMPKEERYTKWTGLNASQIMEDQRRSLAKRSEMILPEKRQSRSADYRNKLPHVKNQRGCGSCWSFGAIAALEYQINRKSPDSKEPKSLSEQQYLDCVYEGKRDGCNGGWPTDCYAWTRDNGNFMALEKEYPYTEIDGRCKAASEIKNPVKGYSVTGFRYLSKGDSSMLAAVMDPEIGVISVAFGVVDSFFQYKSGVYASSGCNAINHALDVVGYGTGFWIARNSWGSNWGDKGYVNVKRGGNTCNIAEYGHYPLVTGSDPDDGDDESNGDDESDGEDGSDGDDESDDGDKDKKKVCRWVSKPNLKMKRKIQGLEKMSEEEAKEACESNEKCKAVTCKNKNNCWLNEKPRGKENENFVGYVLKCKPATS